MTRPRVVLIGLPGVGKSVVGSRLARRLQLEFADSDDLVVAQTGRSVQDIFATDGQPGFRAIEAQVITAALATFTGVLSLGGGAVTTPVTRAELAASGAPVLLLTAPLDELLRRVGGPGAAVRPLLAHDPGARLAALSAERQPLYRQLATSVIDTTGRTVAQVCAAIELELERSATSQP